MGFSFADLHFVPNHFCLLPFRCFFAAFCPGSDRNIINNEHQEALWKASTPFDFDPVPRTAATDDKFVTSGIVLPALGAKLLATDDKFVTSGIVLPATGKITCSG
jgi:hypothetical protein